MPLPSLHHARFASMVFLCSLAILAGCRGGGERIHLHGNGATPPATADGRRAYDRPGFVTYADRGRLWVFDADSDDLARFQAHGEPRRSVTLVGAGPRGMDLRAADRDTLERYLRADRR